MRFKLKKLPLEKAVSLRQVAVDAVEPYAPLPAPVYLLMSRNQKFISIKGPFDFFTPREIQGLKTANQVYYSDFLDRVAPFREAARRVKATMCWQAPSKDGLEPASYEISDAILKIVAELWAPIGQDQPEGLGIESYFAVVFTNELCEPLPSDRLTQARDMDVDRYELGILRSGVAVFFALHLGIVDLDVLNQLRYRIFVETVRLSGASSLIPYSSELDELRKWVETVVHDSHIHLISSDQFKYSLNRASQKLKSRLARVRRELMDPQRPLMSAYGAEGVLADKDEEDADE